MKELYSFFSGMNEWFKLKRTQECLLLKEITVPSVFRVKQVERLKRLVLCPGLRNSKGVIVIIIKYIVSRVHDDGGKMSPPSSTSLSTPPTGVRRVSHPLSDPNLGPEG